MKDSTVLAVMIGTTIFNLWGIFQLSTMTQTFNRVLSTQATRTAELEVRVKELEETGGPVILSGRVIELRKDPEPCRLFPEVEGETDEARPEYIHQTKRKG